MDTVVVKIGGATGVDASSVSQDIASLAAMGQRLVVVHGASGATDRLAEQAGVPVRRLTSPNGHTSRYTNPEMLDLYVAAAAGQMNKGLVARLQHLGCNAFGVSGADGRLLQAQRKGALRTVEQGRQRIVRDDFSGQIIGSNPDILRVLLQADYVPVVAPLALGCEGELLNVDGDRVAAHLASVLGARALVILSNVPGLLSAYPDERSLVRRVPAGQLAQASVMAQGRMKTKILAADEALRGGVRQVILADSRRTNPLQAALAGEGTVIGDDAGLMTGLPISWPMPAAQQLVEGN